MVRFSLATEMGPTKSLKLL